MRRKPMCSRLMASISLAPPPSKENRPAFRTNAQQRVMGNPQVPANERGGRRKAASNTVHGFAYPLHRKPDA
jgi:hypothetical protein